MNKTNTSVILLGLAVLGSGALIFGGIVVLRALPAWALAVVAVVLVLLLPVAFWAGWRLGSRDARAFVDGIERGTGAVITAGGRVADLRREKSAGLRQATAPADIRLPDTTKLEIVDGDGGGWVEL